MRRCFYRGIKLTGLFLSCSYIAFCQQLKTAGQPAQLAIRQVSNNSVRITLKPISYKHDYPYTPALVDRKYNGPAILITSLPQPIKKKIGQSFVEVNPSPLTITVTNLKGQAIQKFTFDDNGTLAFTFEGQPVLGMGEGGHTTPA